MSGEVKEAKKEVKQETGTEPKLAVVMQRDRKLCLCLGLGFGFPHSLLPGLLDLGAHSARSRK